MKMRSRIILMLIVLLLLQNVSFATDLPKHVEGQAVFFADSEEEAEEIASYYNAELLEFEDGVGILTGIGDEAFEENDRMMVRSASVTPKIFPNYMFYTCEENLEALSKGDSEFIEGSTALGWYHERTNVFDAWRVTRGEYIDSSDEIVVAVIDSGVDEEHEDLIDNIDDVCNFCSEDENNVEDISGHGTHVAGIIAATANEVGTTGVAPNVRLMILKALDTDTQGGQAAGTLYDVACAAIYAVNNGADIINMSLSAEGIEWDAFEQLFEAINDNNVIVVCAAGNEGNNVENIPASYDSTIAVTASTLTGPDTDGLASYSNFGRWVDIAAPGSYIYSTLPGDEYGFLSGTSMATPVISGVCALIKAVDPDIDTAEEALVCLNASTNTVGESGYTYKVVNASMAVQAAYDNVFPMEVTADNVTLATESWYVGENKNINLETIANVANGSGEYVYEIIDGELPGGLKLDGNIISGTLKTICNASNVTVRVGDEKNPLEFKDITIAFPTILKSNYDDLNGRIYVASLSTSTYSLNLTNLNNYPANITSATFGINGVDDTVSLTDTDGLINGTVSLEDGVIRFSTNEKASGVTSQIVLQIASQNYNNINVRITVEARDMIPSWSAVTVRDSIMYGSKVSTAVTASGTNMVARLGEENLTLTGAYLVVNASVIPDSGSYTVEYTFTVSEGDFDGVVFSNTSQIHVNRKLITEDMVEVEQTYNNGGTVVNVTVEDTINNEDVVLAENTDYTLQIQNIENQGEKRITVTGIGNYTGVITKDSIKPELSGTVTVSNNDVDSSGTITSGDILTAVISAITPSINESDIDYEWLLNGTDTGVTTLTFTVPENSAGKSLVLNVKAKNDGNYTGKVSITNLISYLPLEKINFCINNAEPITVGTVLELNQEFVGTYRINWYRDNSVSEGEAIANATDSTYQITANDEGKRITAVATGIGEYTGMYVTAGVSTASVPSAPVISSVKSGESVTVSWTEPANGGSSITGYIVYISENTGEYAPSNVPASTYSKQYSDLNPGTYSFKVIATNAVGSSSASNIVSQTISRRSSSGGGGGGGGSSSKKKVTKTEEKTEIKTETEEPVQVETPVVQVPLDAEKILGEMKEKKKDEKVRKLPITDEELNKWENSFTDIKEKDWYYEGIRYASLKGLMNGTGNNKFSPKEKTTRAMLVRILWNLAGNPEVTSENVFNDVEKGVWYEDAVRWATGSNIVSGYGDGEFAPNEILTREQMITIIFNYMDFEVLTAQYNLEGFEDQAEISEYARKAMNWAVGEGIMSGVSDTKIDPKGTTTRGQLSVVLEKLFNKK